MSKLLLLFLLFLLSCRAEKIPKVQVRTLDNRVVYLSDYKGRDTLLYVWSKTCAGHSKDLKELNRLVEERKEFLIISYAVAMTSEDVLKSYRELGIRDKFLTLIDTEVRFNDHLPITFLPSTYIFDKRGKLLKTHPGLYIPTSSKEGSS
ncbi:MAG: TlpA family protein disulfide reductase [Aquificaceae bacterium]|nr:TlpA family protein disulfide reductase [Aquificaceae bacterium]